jgi:cellulose biosynthesis protein BcsQ
MEMQNVTQVKIKELASLFEMPSSNVSRWITTNTTEDEILKVGRKTIGLAPSVIEKFFRERGKQHLYEKGVYIVNSITGGVSKTATAINLAMAFSRISDRKSNPIILIDCDPQASATLQMTGSADFERPILADYFEGRVKAIDLLWEIGDGIFLIPSSLGNIYNERLIGSPKRVKESGQKLISELFQVFEQKNTKIFIDTSPSISSVTSSFVMAINNYREEEIQRKMVLPCRSDSFALKGCEYSLSETMSLLDSFNEKPNIEIITFLSMYDQRVKHSVTAMKNLLENEALSKLTTIAPNVIRYSSEIVKSQQRTESVFSSSPLTPVANDFMELLFFILGGVSNEAH